MKNFNAFNKEFQVLLSQIGVKYGMKLPYVIKLSESDPVLSCEDINFRELYPDVHQLVMDMYLELQGKYSDGL